jgi:uncharacterized protein YqfA (UPF0365 family)
VRDEDRQALNISFALFFAAAAPMAQDRQGIVVSHVTVRTNIDRLVCGAGEETIIARVGEGMVSNHWFGGEPQERAGDPDHISKHILSKGSTRVARARSCPSTLLMWMWAGISVRRLQIDQANADKQSSITLKDR